MTKTSSLVTHKHIASLQNFDNLPSAAMIRLPVVMGLFGCSAATVWRMVKAKTLTAYHLTPRTTTFSVGEIRKLIEKAGK